MFAPFWERTRTTGYGQCLRIAIRDLFDVADLNAATHAKLSAAIAASRRTGWYRHVLKDKARIDIGVLDDYRTDVDRELFVPVIRLDHFACPTCRADLAAIEADTGRSVHGVDDLVQAMQASLERGIAEGAVGIKIGIAYRRSIRFERTPRVDAERVFDALFAHLGEGPSWQESRPLQDYLFHQIVRAAVERDLPIQIHTGLLEGNGNLLENSNPLHLAGLCLEYRKARIDLFHGGYPYLGEALALAKTFPGVHLDLCWLHIVSPSASARVLHEAIETVPCQQDLRVRRRLHRARRQLRAQRDGPARRQPRPDGEGRGGLAGRGGSRGPGAQDAAGERGRLLQAEAGRSLRLFTPTGRLTWRFGRDGLVSMIDGRACAQHHRPSESSLGR